MTTPNTTGPSAEIQRWTYRIIGGRGGERVLDRIEATYGEAVLHSDHLAALSRAREEARKEALQDAKFAAEATGRVVTDGLVRLGRYEQGYARARADIEYAIHALLTRAPSPAVKALVAAARPLTEIVMKQCGGYTSGPGFDAAQLARVAIEALAAVEREIGGA